MRTWEIRSGSVDVRLSESGADVCIVFESTDAQLRLFRVMPIDEARAFLVHLAERMAVAS